MVIIKKIYLKHWKKCYNEWVTSTNVKIYNTKLFRSWKILDQCLKKNVYVQIVMAKWGALKNVYYVFYLVANLENNITVWLPGKLNL